MRDGESFSPRRKRTFCFFSKSATRSLLLCACSLLTAPYGLLRPAYGQSLTTVTEDENHISSDWISALRLDGEEGKKPILCRLSGTYGKLGLWASKKGLEITSEDTGWELPEKSGGEVTLTVHNHFVKEHIDPNKDLGEPVKPVPFRGRLTPDFQDTFFMIAQTKTRMGAAITAERLIPLLSALAQGESATLRFGEKPAETLSLDGAGRAVSDFRQCAYDHHFADLRPIAEKEGNILEGEAEDEDSALPEEEEDAPKEKQTENPYKDPFALKSAENPWPKPKNPAPFMIDAQDDPDSPDTPNEFSEQPSAPGAPPPLTPEEQAEKDRMRAIAVQEKEQAEEMARQKQIEAEEEAEAEKRAQEREAKRLEAIAAAKQAAQARRQRAIAKLKAKKAALRAQALAKQKARNEAIRKSKIEPKRGPTPEELEAERIRAQSAKIGASMENAQEYLSVTQENSHNKRKTLASNLASQQLDTARAKLRAQAEAEAKETARGSQAQQNQRLQEATISLTQAENFLSQKAQRAKTRRTRKAAQNLTQELLNAQNFLEAQSAGQSPAPLNSVQQRHAKNSLPFSDLSQTQPLTAEQASPAPKRSKRRKTAPKKTAAPPAAERQSANAPQAPHMITQQEARTAMLPPTYTEKIAKTPLSGKR